MGLKRQFLTKSLPPINNLMIFELNLHKKSWMEPNPVVNQNSTDQTPTVWTPPTETFHENIFLCTS